MYCSLRRVLFLGNVAGTFEIKFCVNSSVDWKNEQIKEYRPVWAQQSISYGKKNVARSSSGKTLYFSKIFIVTCEDEFKVLPARDCQLPIA